jgi:Flp pilus assembly pilin Flp
MTFYFHIHARVRAADGQTMTETAVLMALIFLVVLVGVMIFSSSLSGLWSHLSSTLPGG